MHPYRKAENKPKYLEMVPEDQAIVRKVIRSELQYVLGLSFLGVGSVVGMIAVLLSEGTRFWWLSVILGATAVVIVLVLWFGTVRLRLYRRDLRDNQKERFVTTIERKQIRVGRSGRGSETYHDLTVDGKEHTVDTTDYDRFEEGDFVLVELSQHGRALLWLEPASGEGELDEGETLLNLESAKE